MTIHPAAPRCEKCQAVGVPSYLKLSPTLQYWRCPECFRIWTTLKSAIDQHRESYAQSDSGASARSTCPTCAAAEIVDLRDILHSERADYFRCRVCNCWWFVTTGQDRPATRLVFGNKDDASSAGADDSKKAG